MTLTLVIRVSVRTLHHYDEIGLLKPARLGNNRYRYSAELDRPDFDRIEALRSHRARIERVADLYLSHADFRARYESLASGFTDYLAAAMKAHAARVS